MKTINNSKKEDSYYMMHAIEQAKKALRDDEVPIGAVIVDPEGKIVAKAYNRVHKYGCQTEHAEVRAVKKICKKIGDWRLNGYSIYVTLEPCSMCMGLIRLCRFSRLIYGADSLLFGYRLDKRSVPDVYKIDTVKVQKGILAQESVDILRRFFKKKRDKSGKR